MSHVCPLLAPCAESPTHTVLPISVFPKCDLPLFPDTHHPWASNLLSEVGVNEESQPLYMVDMLE